ncbi:MAG: SPOR domain-containing protein [Limimaricola sp.]|uniref:SPOR domain-containing protein n=1 Tax=Limimaricola sp. TaxID=2211665 RepID=UPI001DDE90A2|nr:SPOR domain-containing protein [Limimaricola sp.]MBI1416200.1 SPOR domain-containing protein [Limimaricola sp.]
MTSRLLRRMDRPGLFAAGALAALALAGCDANGHFAMPGLGGGGSGGADAPASAQASGDNASVQLVEHDVEAPNVFQYTGEGLWDGRPSLGGVWVAHPDVTDPERVIIRNQANGKFVIGALFRRERNNPGPALQVSSDAADALGMLAGAPATLNVTALRREPTAPPAPPAATTNFDQPSDISATPLDPVTAGASAAIDAAEASSPGPVMAPGSVAAAAPATAAPAAAPAPRAPAARPTAAVAKPFIQLGIFSIEANATRAVDRLKSAGVTAQVLHQESQGKEFWRVVVGPLTDPAERRTALAKVKAQGFPDAYFVTN